MTVDHSIFEYTNYVSFIDLFESQVARHHERVFTLYQLPNTSKLEFRTLTYGQFDSITTCLAHEWSSQLETVHRVGILTDVSIQSFLAMLVVLKLGKTFFPISTGNSETTITQLLASTDTQFLIASGEYRRITQSCTRGLPTVCVKIWESSDLERLTIPSFSYSKRIYWPATKPNDIAIILQSSGTTGRPKPIYLDNRWLVIQTLNPPIQRRSDGIHSSEPCIKPNDTLLSTSAAFHAFGLGVYLTPLMVGAKVFVFHKLPPCTQDLLAAATKCNATIMTASPANLEALVKYLHTVGDNESTIGVLKQLKFCLYSGAPLSLDVRNALQFKGLKLRCVYGSTEIGLIARSNLSENSQHWDTLKPIDFISNYCRWEPFDAGLYHLMIRSDYPSLRPGITVSVTSDGYYATNDLFREDPPMSGYWRLVKRISDTLVLSDGGKTDPLVFEKEICKSCFVKRCIVVGHNKRQTAVLVELDVEQSSSYQPNHIISEVHAAVQAANLSAAQAHSVISVPGMIYILPPNRKLPTTFKGTIARKEAVEQFEKEIDEMYNGFVENTITYLT